MKFASVIFFISFLFFQFPYAIAQVQLEGYTYETGNRGFISDVSILVINSNSRDTIVKIASDKDGKFYCSLPLNSSFYIVSVHPEFESQEKSVLSSGKSEGDMVFVEFEMQRKPGYHFDITLAEKRESPEEVVDAIKGALIEVFNNTRKETVMTLANHPDPDFQVYLEKNNHYTILVRKEGYLTKRMEAYVNIAGCILCFEGVGTVQPGVTENLTNNNLMGSLLANVEMENLFEGKKIELKNIYYDYNKSDIRADAAIELDKVISFMKDNPNINVELGSHTDSRGKTKLNNELSEKRARSAATYLINNGIEKSRLSYKGYGESQILNKCKNGVNCAEAEHEINRRTELKIVKVASQKSFVPLAELKRLEEMENLIKELQNQEQIKVTGDTELPKGLELPPTPDSIKENILQGFKNTDKTSPETEEGGKDQTIEALQTEQNYTGYKIVVYFSRYPLPESHSIITTFKNDLEVQKTSQGNYIYLTGSFAKKETAEGYLQKIQGDYPQAYLVYYENGKRVL